MAGLTQEQIVDATGRHAALELVAFCQFRRCCKVERTSLHATPINSQTEPASTGSRRRRGVRAISWPSTAVMGGWVIVRAEAFRSSLSGPTPDKSYSRSSGDVCGARDVLQRKAKSV